MIIFGIVLLIILLTWYARSFQLNRKKALSISKVQKTDSKDFGVASEISACHEDVISQSFVNVLSTESIASIVDPSNAPINILSIQELIEQGFIEKSSDNYERAAYFFNRALSLDPIPDLAFYLMIDCYWLWNNLGERKYALTQLQAYIPKYLPQFNPELRHQFDAWMTKENLHNVE